MSTWNEVYTAATPDFGRLPVVRKAEDLDAKERAAALRKSALGLLPIGSLIYLLFCVTKWGWGFDKYLAEANRGTGLKFSPKLKLYFQWILPILILIILIQGLI